MQMLEFSISENAKIKEKKKDDRSKNLTPYAQNI